MTPMEPAQSRRKSSNIKNFDILLSKLSSGNISKTFFEQHTYLFDPVEIDQQLLSEFLSVLLEPGTDAQVMNLLVDVNEKLHSNTLKANLLRWKMSYELEIMGEQRVIALQFVHAVAMYERSHLIEPLCRCDVNFNASTEEGFTPLMLASRFGHVEVVKKLCNAVQSLDGVCQSGFTALHFAVCYNHKEVVEVLLDNGADIKVSTGGYVGYSIVFAILMENSDMFESLWNNLCGRFEERLPQFVSWFEKVFIKVLQAVVAVGNNTNIEYLRNEYKGLCKQYQYQPRPDILDTPDEAGNTLVMIASAKGDIPILKSLILLKAKVDLKNNDGDTALHIAASKGEAKIVDLLVKNSHIILGICNKKGHTPLHAAFRGHGNQLDTAQIIIDAIKCDQKSILTMQDLTGRAAIHLVAVGGHIQLATVLLETDPNSWKLRTNSNHTALHIAALHGFKEFVKLIIQDNDDDEVVRFYRWKNSGVATQFNGSEDEDTSSNEQDPVGLMCTFATLLHAAAMSHEPPFHGDTDETIEKKKAEVMKLLLGKVPTEHIVHLDRQKLMQDQNGCNPLHLAVKNKHDFISNSIIDFIVKSPEDAKNRIIPALMGCKDNDGRTPLFVAASNGLVETTKRLMNLYPDSLLISDQTKKTPLHIAAGQGHAGVVGAILKFIAKKDVNQQDFCKMADHDGNNALHCAALSGYVDVVEQLFKYCPSLLLKRNHLGETPLYLAACEGHHEVTNKLLHSCTNQESRATKEILYYRYIITATKTRSNMNINTKRKATDSEPTRIVYFGQRSLSNALTRSRSYPTNEASPAGVRQRSKSYSEQPNQETTHLRMCSAFYVAYKKAKATGFRPRSISLSAEPNPQTTYFRERSALHAAADNGHSSVVEKICEFLTTSSSESETVRPALSLMFDETGQTPAHLAFERGHRATIDVFLLCDPEILKLKTVHLQTPLHRAVENGHIEVVQYIIDFVTEKKNQKGFKNLDNVFNLRDANGYTLMHSAAKLKSPEIFKLLLNFPKAITACDTTNNWTPLHVAAERGNIEVVKTCIDFFESNTDDLVRVSRMNEIAMLGGLWKETALYLAASNGHKEICALLLPFSRGTLTQKKNNPMHIASENGHIGTVEIILKHISEYQSSYTASEFTLLQDEKGNTSLHLAANKGHVEVVKMLLKHSTFYTVGLKNKRKWTALHTAAACGHASVVKAIVEAIGNNQFNEGDASRRSPLHLAAIHGHFECIKELTCVDYDKRCISGNTALGICAENLDIAGVKWLLEKGADVNIKNNKGQTIIHMVVESGNTECIPAQKNECGRRNDIQNDGTPQTKKNHVLNILLGKFDTELLNVLDNRGRTALMICVGKNDTTSVKRLLEYESIRNVKDRSGETALHKAVKHGYIECIRALECVDCEIQSNTLYDKPTASRYAARSCKAEVVKAFIETFSENGESHGSLNESDKDLYTKLVRFAEQGNEDGVKELIKQERERRCIFNAELKVTILNKLYGLIVEYPEIKNSLDAIVRLVKKLTTKSDDGSSEDSDEELTDISNGELNALHYAARSNKNTVLKVFLETFPNITEELINHPDKKGYTALMICAEKLDVVGVKLLTECNAVLRPKTEGNILHKLIEQYVGIEEKENPHKDKLLEIIKLVNNNDVNHDPQKCTIKNKNITKQTMIPIELSAAAGSADVLEVLLEKKRVPREDKTVAFYMEGIVPLALLQPPRSSNDRAQYSANDPEHGEYARVSDAEEGVNDPEHVTLSTNTEAEDESDMRWQSCVERIVNHCNESEVLEMMKIQPLRVFLKKFSKIRSAAFFIAGAFHIAYMLLFTWFTWSHSSYRCDSSFSNQTSGPFAKSSSDRSNRIPWSFVFCFWSCIIIFVNIVHLTTLPIGISKLSANYLLTYLLTNCKNCLPFSTGLSREASIASYISFFDIFSQLLRFVLPILVFIWSIIYSILTDDSNPTNVGLTTAILVLGWLQTIDYTKGFSTVYAFYFTLKLVLVRDLLRIAIIYVFVLIGFACAADVLIRAELPWNGRNYTLAHSFYEIYGAMLGRGDLFSLASENGYQFHRITGDGIRVFIAFYISISTILILNISIAATGSAFSQVSELKKTLWCMETIHFVNWIAQDHKYTSMLRAVSLSLFKQYIFKDYGTTKPYIVE